MPAFARRGLGYRPDRRHLFGHADRDASALLAAAPPPPAAADNGWTVLDILDQGRAPFCVANATAQAVRCCQVRNGVVAPRLASRLWLMYLAHAIDGAPDAFDGTYVRNAFEALERLGFPPEEVWTYDDSPSGRYKIKPPADAFRQAYDRIAPVDYQRILSTGAQRVDDVKRALAGGNPVVFGTNVSEDFADNKGTLQPIDPPVGQAIAGGHALVWVGYQGDVFRGPNSWGREWGQDGWFEMTADYVAWPDTQDVWICNFKGQQA